jgi:hypothetical protein
MGEAGNTNKLARSNDRAETQRLYLIRDYRGKSGNPTNYIKIPVISEKVKIVEIQTGRKKTHKKRVVK